MEQLLKEKLFVQRRKRGMPHAGREETERHSCIGVMSFSTEALIENDASLHPPQQCASIDRQPRRGYWSIFEFVTGERISLLYLLVEAIQGINALYVKHGISPTVFVQHDQTMGHCWGSFAVPFNRIVREHGLSWPSFLIIGQSRTRVGPPDAYRTLCYDKAHESMFRNVHEIRVHCDHVAVRPTDALTHWPEDIAISSLSQRIADLTIPCTDNGHHFICTERIDVIATMLRSSLYGLVGDLPLVRIYQHRDFRADRPLVIVSAHIDSQYSRYWTRVCSGEVRGTLDNSICIAILIEMMLTGQLPTQVLVALTGDEEGSSGGADQFSRYLGENDILWQNVEMIVSMDLTEEGYGTHPFTIENVCAEEDHVTQSHLRFSSGAEMQYFLECLLPGTAFIIEGDEDDTWQYDEYDFNCFSFCLPCGLIGSDMHDCDGVAVSLASLSQYGEALVRVLKGLLETCDRQDRHRALVQNHTKARISRAENNIWNAIRRNDTKAVIALLSKGLDRNAMLRDGQTLAEYALKCGRPDIARILKGTT
jgi:hypothetical protein